MVGLHVVRWWFEGGAVFYCLAGVADFVWGWYNITSRVSLGLIFDCGDLLCFGCAILNGFAGLVSSASGCFGLGGFAVVLYCGLFGCRFGYGNITTRVLSLGLLPGGGRGFW